MSNKWIECGLTWGFRTQDYYDELDATCDYKIPDMERQRQFLEVDTRYRARDTFTSLCLNLPGTLIEYEISGQIHQALIGDSGPGGGDEDNFREDIVIIRYKRIWSPEQ